MKQVVAIAIAALSSFIAIANNSDTTFKKYEQTIPGSEVKFIMVPVASGSFLMEVWLLTLTKKMTKRRSAK